MQKKIIFFAVVIVLFLVVLFLDQNSAPVPVKFILGDPHPIGLSAIIIASLLVGVVLAILGTLIFKSVRKTVKKEQHAIE